VCKDQSTRQRMTTGLPGKHLCRVLNPWHTAKVPFFAVCCGIWHTANFSCLPCVMALAHGKVALSPSAAVIAFFLPSVELCTRQRLCRVPDKKPTAKKAFADAWLPCATHGKAFVVCKPGFAVCFRHTANSLCPVVRHRQPQFVLF